MRPRTAKYPKRALFVLGVVVGAWVVLHVMQFIAATIVGGPGELADGLDLKASPLLWRRRRHIARAATAVAALATAAFVTRTINAQATVARRLAP